MHDQPGMQRISSARGNASCKRGELFCEPLHALLNSPPEQVSKCRSDPAAFAGWCVVTNPLHPVLEHAADHHAAYLCFQLHNIRADVLQGRCELPGSVIYFVGI